MWGDAVNEGGCVWFRTCVISSKLIDHEVPQQVCLLDRDHLLERGQQLRESSPHQLGGVLVGVGDELHLWVESAPGVCGSVRPSRQLGSSPGAVQD